MLHIINTSCQIRNVALNSVTSENENAVFQFQLLGGFGAIEIFKSPKNDVKQQPIYGVLGRWLAERVVHVLAVVLVKLVISIKIPYTCILFT